MSIVNTFSLQSNRQIKINFDGGVRQFGAEYITGENPVW